MKLVTLGGSAGGPNPRDACSGYLVTGSNTNLLLDCGPAVVSQLRSWIEGNPLDGIVISHLHADHTLDLVTLRYTLRYAPNKPPASYIPLYLPPGGLAFLERLGRIFQKGNERTEDFWRTIFSPREYDPRAQLSLGATTVEFSEMPHYIPSWAIRVTDQLNGSVLTYSGDTGPNEQLSIFAADSNLFLCEATYLEYPADESRAIPAHLTAADAGRIATSANVSKLVLTHLWGDNGIENYIAAARSTFNGPVESASAGKVFALHPAES